MVAQSIKQEIDGLLRQWENCFNSGDMDGLAALYTPDGTLMPPDSDAIHGREGIAGFWRAAQAGGVKEIRLHIGEVEQSGDLAVEISTATLTMQAGDGAATQVPLKYVVAWKQQAGGTWELMVDIWNTRSA